MKKTLSIIIWIISMSCLYSQESYINGKVIDINTNEVLPGVNISVLNSTKGTLTDLNGEFSISANKGEILKFSFIGYKSQEVTFENQSTLNIGLELSTSQLDDIVVVGYGTQKKGDLTGAIASIKAEDFTPGANYDAVQLLNGSASGVNVSQVSSAPGAGLKIQVRGAGSINSSNSVLFVVDGLPGVDPSSLSPEDIESIEVLKDASSAAIYGTRAANGVVLITTKKGQTDKSSFEYSGYYGIQTNTKNLDVLGAKDYMNLVNMRETSIGNSEVYSDQEINSNTTSTNWQNQLFENAPIQNHQISFSNGNKKGNYYVGLNYFNQKGIVKTSDNSKINLRLNTQIKPIKNLVINSSLNFTRENTNSILFSNSANEAAGPINSAIQFDPTLPSGLNDLGRYHLNPIIALDNPEALLYGLTNGNVSNRVYASVNTEYEIVKNLKAGITLGGESNNSRSDFYRDRSTIGGLSNGGIGSIGNSEYTHWLAEGTLKYAQTFNNIHDFSILGGVTFEEFVTRGIGASSAGFLSDVTNTNLLQSGNGDLLDNVSSSKFINKLNGFLGRATYGFNNKYLFTGSFRVDGSSRFSEQNKYAFFPSASLGWRVSHENFLADVSWLNELKLRVGYGELGNQGINNFETIQTLVAGGNSIFGGEVAQGVLPARLPNPDLKWETTSEINIGIDYAILNNRISGSLDLFNRKTTDQLFFKPLPSVVGFTSVRTNLGDVENKGIDFNLKSLNIDKELKWNSNFTMSFLRNKVTELPEFTQEIISGGIGTFITQYSIVKTGLPLRSFYGYETNGIFQLGDDIANSPTPNVTGYKAGMPKFVDQNNDGVINADDRVSLGDPFPDFTFGLNNNFNYKGFSLGIFLIGVYGIETLDANITESLYPTNSARNSLSKYYLERWTEDNPTNALPSGENASLYGGGLAINDLTVVDASFLRLKNITFGYSLPHNSNKGLKNTSVYFSVDNLFTATNYQGYDPDASASGTGVERTSYNSYPLARTYRVGVKLKF